MALPNETNEQDLLNIIQGGQPLTPQQFASYIYQGAPGDHAAATQRGLEYLQPVSYTHLTLPTKRIV